MMNKDEPMTEPNERVPDEVWLWNDCEVGIIGVPNTRDRTCDGGALYRRVPPASSSPQLSDDETKIRWVTARQSDYYLLSQQDTHSLACLLDEAWNACAAFMREKIEKLNDENRVLKSLLKKPDADMQTKIRPLEAEIERLKYDLQIERASRIQSKESNQSLKIEIDKLTCMLTGDGRKVMLALGSADEKIKSLETEVERLTKLCDLKDEHFNIASEEFEKKIKSLDARLAAAVEQRNHAMRGCYEEHADEKIRVADLALEALKESKT